MFCVYMCVLFGYMMGARSTVCVFENHSSPNWCFVLFYLVSMTSSPGPPIFSMLHAEKQKGLGDKIT